MSHYVAVDGYYKLLMVAMGMICLVFSMHTEPVQMMKVMNKYRMAKMTCENGKK
jgi:hypothetical protein